MAVSSLVGACDVDCENGVGRKPLLGSRYENASGLTLGFRQLCSIAYACAVRPPAMIRSTQPNGTERCCDEATRVVLTMAPSSDSRADLPKAERRSCW